ncbi:hypothetical protein RD792_007740 [Penstemon davidsonii]|uniref:Cysteine-rich receptor-like protein kinase 10 n=1 Tax=Penstemon davidsonii TaxID=160366 RepID=A0ABR0D8K2_9LAMI|nr:hypothetical protein RD792_007740 [Penstemon davidsonii]
MIMSSQRKLLAFYFIVLANLLALVKAQHYNCGDNGNYTSNSTYKANLNTLLSYLSTNNVDSNGFYNASMGQNPDRVNAIVLCRGDAQLDTCRTCIQNATIAIVKNCPYEMQADAILGSELCMLRYSNETIFGTMSTYPVWWVRNSVNASSPDQFNIYLRTLLDNLQVQAASGGSLRKVAAGKITAPDFQTIFALVQCTPDLSQEECKKCLNTAALDLPKCCKSQTGAEVLYPSCYILYSLTSFYNQSRLEELKQVPPPPQTAPPQPLPIPSPPPEDINVVESLHYDFYKIRAATNDFSEDNKLGQGGFGPVYKGKLLSGQEIAVKRLSRNSGQGDLEFKNEVLLLAKLQHRNLVRLLGFSIGGKEKLLVYEFVENASLDHFIFGSTEHSNLDWQQRYKIIKGITRGLLYLHEDSRLRIIHRDLKASNILLDGDMNPKIADFGMARLVLTDETQSNTSRIVGTYGYMSPEYAMHGQFSVKSDVFSFGVIVLEIISGQKSYSFRDGHNPKGRNYGIFY